MQVVPVGGWWGPMLLLLRLVVVAPTPEICQAKVCRIHPQAVADLAPYLQLKTHSASFGALAKEGKTSIQPKISISYIYDHLCNLCEKEFWTHGFMKFLRRWPTKEQSRSITGCDAIECSFFRGTLGLYSFHWIFLTFFDFSLLSWSSNILRVACVIYLCSIPRMYC